MPIITYGGQSYQCSGRESVLDCLTAQGAQIPSSCRAGLCQACMMRALSGKVPEAAQKGLKPTLVAQNYFLACSWVPQEDIEIALPDSGAVKLPATVISISRLNSEIAGIRLAPSRNLEYRAGQFISLYKDPGVARAYSLASVPELDDSLYIHVRKVPDGVVSSWIHDGLQAGDVVDISEAAGDCFYVQGNPEQGLLLIGTGSGLAPLYGIVRDALKAGHTGPIRLYHGSYQAEGLYLVQELRELARSHPNFRYVPCVSEGDTPEGYAKGMVLDVALAENPKLSGWRVFLCGNPDMVGSAKRQTFLAGASMREIYADPFVPANS